MRPMDTRASVSIVPPAGAPPPPRTKSLRQQRAANGATIIKSYVQQSEQRREQSRFHATGRTPRLEGASYGSLSPRGRLDERWEDDTQSPMAERQTPRMDSARNNQRQHDLAEDAHALDALFSERRVRRSRRSSVVAQGRPLAPQVTGNPPSGGDQTGVSNTGIKPVMRRRLQMETLSMAMQSGAGQESYRPTTVLLVPHHPRARHNLGAKLDALAKTSTLSRRKVVLTGDEKAVKNLARTIPPRHGNGLPPGSGSEPHHGSGSSTKEGAESATETRVMTAFRQIVRLWRERKRKAEAAALNRMNGNTSGIATGTGRNGSKLRKDLTAQQSNVVGIISKRLIREIPALKLFDEETEALPPSTTAGKACVPAATVPERAKPRGVCYTLDAFGCRKIKMQSSTTIAEPSRQPVASQKQQKTVPSEELTLEKAMHRSLHRKMARRIKSRRQSIVRLGEEFSKARNDLAMKLRSHLALQQAQMEKMFTKRLTLLMTDDTTLPPYMAQKELHLARVRCRKANVLEKCDTLRVLGLVLRYVEARGNASGLEASTGELHFLDLFRCVVEENHVLTPIISTAIRQHMRAQDLKLPVIMELFEILDSEMHGREQPGVV